MRIISAALTVVSMLALAACDRNRSAGNEQAKSNASASINGTWRADLATVQIDTKPEVYLLKDGTFSCSTCTPPMAVAADGAFHSVTGHPYADEISVKADDKRTVTEVTRKGGKTIAVIKNSVSPDGNTLTVSFTQTAVANAKPVTGAYTETRAAAAPAGAHAISGSWAVDKINTISDEGLTETLQLDGDTLHVSSPVGTSYDAKLDGTPMPIKGDIGGSTVSVKKLADGRFQETFWRAGKVQAVSTLSLGRDGKLHVVNEDKQNGTIVRYLASRT
jgi:hypothetical protein